MAAYLKICCLVGFVASIACSQFDCSRIEYDRCVKIADPLIKEARLIFPDNVEDIALVCRTWNKFVDCLKRYIDRCFTEQQRRQFNKAVENPVESVHQMCTQQSYQQGTISFLFCFGSLIFLCSRIPAVCHMHKKHYNRKSPLRKPVQLTSGSSSSRTSNCESFVVLVSSKNPCCV